MYYLPPAPPPTLTDPLTARHAAILLAPYASPHYTRVSRVVEVTWKSKLRLAYPDPNAYSAFMGNFSTLTGIVTFAMMFFGKFILGRFGWGTASLITPVTLLLTGAGFFSLSLFPDFFAPLVTK